MTENNPFLPKSLASLTQQKPLLGVPPSPFGQQAQSILSAQTGKEKAPTAFQGPAKSNLAELAAQDQTKQGLGQVQEQRGMQSQLFQAEQARQKEQEQQQLEQLDADELNQREELLNRGEEIMQEWRNQGTQLDLKKKAAQTEQLGFIARLSDDTYVNNLKREGRKARLNNKLKFQEELQKAIFDDERELFESDLSFKQAMKQDAREFKELLANEGLDWKKALQVAEMKSQATQQTWTGIGQLGQAGISTYGQVQADERAARIEDKLDAYQMNPRAPAPYNTPNQGSIRTPASQWGTVYK